MIKLPIRRYFLAGLLVWLPILATLFVLNFIIKILDTSLALIPDFLTPQHLFGFRIPGLGVVLSIIILFTTGLMVTNFIGKRMVTIGEWVVGHIPLARTVYSAVKQVLQTLFASENKAFRSAVLIQYPSPGIWTIAFQTSGEALYTNPLIADALISVYIPTTPNPTSGFLMLVPEREVIKLEMSIDEALKMVISLGVVQPEGGIR
jgi:uncharacterized membrane protein